MTNGNASGTKKSGVLLRPVFIAWKEYQRRAEMLAPLLGCSCVSYFPHLFEKKILRPFDYLIELVETIVYFLRRRPTLAILQAPPVFSALASILTRTPYVVDIHNTLVQSFWSNIPMTGAVMRHAAVLIAHNSEIAAVVQAKYPNSRVVTITDPIEVISENILPRGTNEILIICSFDRDEPIGLILDTIRALPEFAFTITGNVKRLSGDLQLAFRACKNLRLTGFVSTDAYHSLLCSSKAAVVLSTMPAVQPSGAVEALASNTPLIVTRTSLAKELFGEWAVLVDNNLESLIASIRGLRDDPLDLSLHRSRWSEGVRRGISDLMMRLAETPGFREKS